MTLLQNMLIENENNSFNIEIIKNHIYAIAENNGVTVEMKNNQIFWYGDDEAVAEAKNEAVISLKESYPELF